MRTLVVGDIHGCLEEFDELMAKAAFKPGEDRLILAGDLIDRGPYSLGVLRRAMELKAEAVLGNHESKHIRFRNNENRKKTNPQYVNMMRPMVPTRAAEHASYTDDDIEWMRKLPLSIDIGGGWRVIHAGCDPTKKFDAQEDSHLLYCRHVHRETGKMVRLTEEKDMDPEKTAYWAEVWPGPENIVFGHNVFDKPMMVHGLNGAKSIAIDTGCCFGGALTTAIFNKEFTAVEIVSVPSRQPFAERENLSDPE